MNSLGNRFFPPHVPAHYARTTRQRRMQHMGGTLFLLQVDVYTDALTGHKITVRGTGAARLADASHPKAGVVNEPGAFTLATFKHEATRPNLAGGYAFDATARVTCTVPAGGSCFALSAVTGEALGTVTEYAPRDGHGVFAAYDRDGRQRQFRSLPEALGAFNGPFVAGGRPVAA